MASVESISAFKAFETQLKTLCLGEFPCGAGSWRENNDTTKLVGKIRLSRKDNASTEKKWLDTVDSRFSVTLRDDGIQREKTEVLNEMVTTKESPWNLDYSWSDEAKELREIAVKSPWIIDQKFILQHFRTLRIVDRNVTNLDENLLNFKNLEELTLSANILERVDSSNLPRCLQVLELCANRISDLSSLCKNVPSLIHLGLGHNQITHVEDYITGSYWPKLLSLDLSHNNLNNLMEIVMKLNTFPKLRNLVLQGNPLALVPGYRGYTIDSLKNLDILDDIRISADERHHFKGLARRKEYILDEGKVTLEVPYIKGIPMPDELRYPDEQPEYPIITKKYFVEFLFLKDKSSEDDPDQDVMEKQSVYESHMGDQSSVAPSVICTQSKDGESVKEKDGQSVRGKDVGSAKGRDGGSIRGKDGESVKEKEGESARGKDGESARGKDGESVKGKDGGSARETEAAERESCTEAGQKPDIPDVQVESPVPDYEDLSATEHPLVEEEVKLEPVSSTVSSWSEEMELNWSTLLLRDDLTGLRNFFKQGMDINIVEEKIQSYPADQFGDNDSISPLGSKDDKKGKDGKGADKNVKKDDKGKKEEKKEEKPPIAVKKRVTLAPEVTARGKMVSRLGAYKPRSSGNMKVIIADQPNNRSSNTKKPATVAGRDTKDGSKKKKKGEPDIELMHMPSEFTVLTTFKVPLADFLEGEFEFENVFVHNWEAQEGSRSPESVGNKAEGGKKEKKKPGSAKKETKEPKREKSPKGGKAAKDGKKKEKEKDGKAAAVGEEEEEEGPPPPLEVKVKVALYHWRTAMDSVREERAKEQLKVAAEKNTASQAIGQT